MHAPVQNEAMSAAYELVMNATNANSHMPSSLSISSDGSLVTNGLFDPHLLAVLRPDIGESVGLFSTMLSLPQLSFWQSLLWLRAALAALCWVIATLLQSAPAFGLPPLATE